MDRRRYATAHELGTFTYCPRAWFYETHRCGGHGEGSGRDRTDLDFERGLRVHTRLEATHLADGQREMAEANRTRFPFGLVAGAILLILLGAIVWILL
jgi:hypothetical protein